MNLENETLSGTLAETFKKQSNRTLRGIGAASRSPGRAEFWTLLGLRLKATSGEKNPIHERRPSSRSTSVADTWNLYTANKSCCLHHHYGLSQNRVLRARIFTWVCHKSRRITRDCHQGLSVWWSHIDILLSMLPLALTFKGFRCQCSGVRI